MSEKEYSEQNGTSERIRRFIREAELLKVQERTAWNREGKRESVAEHSWRLALLVLAMEEQLEGFDTARLLRLALVHDLGEAFDGDVSAALETDPDGKEEREQAGVERLTAELPSPARERITALWAEYTRGESPEARAVKALDKIETIIQHNQGRNPAGFDYRFNLDYGRGYEDVSAAVRQLRDLADRETERRAGEAEGPMQRPPT
jgi:putative hydrolase of HD superfamily